MATTTSTVPNAIAPPSFLLRAIVLLARVTMGVVFLYSAYSKLHFDNEWHLRDYHILFAMGIDSYHMLPLWGAELMARVLPWFEMLLGAWLLSGICLRWAGLLSIGLLIMFIAAMLHAMYFGLEINCGCFGNNEKLGVFTLLRDSSFLVPALITTIGAFMLEKRKAPTTS
jgi:putative oxidoreductase